MRKKPRTATLGSVSHGTMRLEDLIPCFLSVAESLRLSKQDRVKVRELRKEWENDYGTDPDANEGDESDRDSAMDDACSELFDLLGNYAPPFAYFGAHEGDGADYGFWLSMDSLEDAVREGEVWRDNGNGAAAPVSDWRYRMVVSDHGNVSLYHRNGREVWSVV